LKTTAAIFHLVLASNKGPCVARLMPLQIPGAGCHSAEWCRVVPKTTIHNKCPESSSEELLIGILGAQLTQTTKNYKMQLWLLTVFRISLRGYILHHLSLAQE